MKALPDAPPFVEITRLIEYVAGKYIPAYVVLKSTERDVYRLRRVRPEVPRVDDQELLLLLHRGRCLEDIIPLSLDSESLFALPSMAQGYFDDAVHRNNNGEYQTREEHRVYPLHVVVKR